MPSTIPETEADYFVVSFGKAFFRGDPTKISPSVTLDAEEAHRFTDEAEAAIKAGQYGGEVWKVTLIKRFTKVAVRSQS